MNGEEQLREAMAEKQYGRQSDDQSLDEMEPQRSPERGVNKCPVQQNRLLVGMEVSVHSNRDGDED